MNNFPFLIFLVVFFSSCGDRTIQNNLTTENKTCIIITNQGPSGSIETDSAGNKFAFRSFKIKVLNDTTLPIDLTLNFSGDSIPLFPGSKRFLRVFLLPDSLAAGKGPGLQINNNKLFQPLKAFLNAYGNSSSQQQVVIPAKKDYTFNIGISFYPKDGDGIVRGGLFADGQNHHINSNLVPAAPLKPRLENAKELKLMFGFGIEVKEPYCYAFIPCGKIKYAK